MSVKPLSREIVITVVADLYDAAGQAVTFAQYIPAEEYYLVKTHGGYDSDVSKLEKEGRLKTIINIRNPYDLCVSWLDVHKKEQQQEIRREGFEEIDSLEKVVSVVKRDIKIAREWLTAYDPLVFRYEDILGDHSSMINKIVDHIGLEVYLYDKVYNTYLKKENITEYNKGIKGRGTEIKDNIPVQARQVFDAFIEEYLA